MEIEGESTSRPRRRGSIIARGLWGGGSNSRSARKEDTPSSPTPAPKHVPSTFGATPKAKRSSSSCGTRSPSPREGEVSHPPKQIGSSNAKRVVGANEMLDGNRNSPKGAVEEWEDEFDTSPQAVTRAPLGGQSLTQRKYVFKIFIVFRGAWCMTSYALLKGFMNLNSAIKRRGGKVIAVTSQGSDRATHSKHEMKIPFHTIGDPTNGMVAEMNRRFNLGCSISLDSMVTDAYPNGMAQPCVLAVYNDKEQDEGSVLFKWGQWQTIGSLRHDEVWREIQDAIMARTMASVKPHGAPLRPPSPPSPHATPSRSRPPRPPSKDTPRERQSKGMTIGQELTVDKKHHGIDAEARSSATPQRKLLLTGTGSTVGVSRRRWPFSGSSKGGALSFADDTSTSDTIGASSWSTARDKDEPRVIHGHLRFPDTLGEGNVENETAALDALGVSASISTPSRRPRRNTQRGQEAVDATPARGRRSRVAGTPSRLTRWSLGKRTTPPPPSSPPPPPPPPYSQTISQGLVVDAKPYAVVDEGQMSLVLSPVKMPPVQQR